MSFAQRGNVHRSLGSSNLKKLIGETLSKRGCRTKAWWKLGSHGEFHSGHNSASWLNKRNAGRWVLYVLVR